MSALFPGITPVRALGSHQSANAGTHTWLTPLDLLAPLGPFDLDPCACPLPRPWSTAATMWTREDAPLQRKWLGRIFLNPPFGPKPLVSAFMQRMAQHNHGTALLFARTETAVFHDWVWPHASGILFLKGRPHFHHQDGRRASANSGAPVCLIAYGPADAAVLSACGLSDRGVDRIAPKGVSSLDKGSIQAQNGNSPDAGNIEAVGKTETIRSVCNPTEGQAQSPLIEMHAAGQAGGMPT